jgi:hypothetical protein
VERITVDKNDLLEKMRGNRERHRVIFLEALDGYRQRAIEQLDGQLKDLRNGKTPQIYISIDRPVDHTRDYDRVIAMLEMHKGSEFTLSETDFSQYALDDWNWKRQWAASNSGYVSGGTRQSNADYFES